MLVQRVVPYRRGGQEWGRDSLRSGEHLYETPLSTEQQLQEREDGSLHLSATVPNTRELQWCLLGLHGGVEVLAPAALRCANR